MNKEAITHTHDTLYHYFRERDGNFKLRLGSGETLEGVVHSPWGKTCFLLGRTLDLKAAYKAYKLLVQNRALSESLQPLTL